MNLCPFAEFPVVLGGSMTPSTRNSKVLRQVLCPRCGQMFSFDPQEVPVQRAEIRGCRYAPVIAHYPVCLHCHEKVEITDTTVTMKLTKRRFRRRK